MRYSIFAAYNRELNVAHRANPIAHIIPPYVIPGDIPYEGNAHKHTRGIRRQNLS